MYVLYASLKLLQKYTLVYFWYKECEVIRNVRDFWVEAWKNLHYWISVDSITHLIQLYLGFGTEAVQNFLKDYNVLQKEAEFSFLLF
jgi:hypothetical protein